MENIKVETRTDEKGLESTGRATNEYFKNLYSVNDKSITLKSDGEDYSNVDFGEKVGDAVRTVYVYASWEIGYLFSEKGTILLDVANGDKGGSKFFVTLMGGAGSGVSYGGSSSYISSINKADELSGFGASIGINFNVGVMSLGGSAEIVGNGGGFSGSVGSAAGFFGNVTLQDGMTWVGTDI